MSRSSPNRHHHRHHDTPQEQIIHRVLDAQPRHTPVRKTEKPDEQRHHLNQSDSDLQIHSHSPNKHIKSTHDSNTKHFIPKKDSYNDEDLARREEPEPFHERFEQFHDNPPTRMESRSRNTGRSRSVPTAHDGKNKLGANFTVANDERDLERTPGRFHPDNEKYHQDLEDMPVNDTRDKVRESGPRSDRNRHHHHHHHHHHHSQNHDEPDRKGNDEISAQHQNGQYNGYPNGPPQEFRESPSDHHIEDSYNEKVSKKVSYAVESPGRTNTTGYPVPEDQVQPQGPIKCRLRAECVETESDLNIRTTIRSRTTRSLSPNRTPRAHSSQLPIVVNSVDSQNSFLPPTSKEDGYLNKSNNNTGSYMGLHQVSQDSMLSGGRPPTGVFSKDILPLPIEIPESVADIQAFRRYLSVRRGALPPSARNSFETRNQTSPSYESLGGRRSGRPMGMTPSRGQLGQEASRRTASLSHAIMTLALLSASICQLRFLISYSHAHSYPLLNYFLIFTSIILELFLLVTFLIQIAAGIGYVMISRCNYDDEKTEAIHNYLIFALFIVAVSNVMLAAFAFDGHICEDSLKREGKSINTPPVHNAHLLNKDIPPMTRTKSVGNKDMKQVYKAWD